MQKLDIKQVRPLIRMAMEEDLGRGDVTTNLLFQDGTRASAMVVSREEIVVAGFPVVKEILRQYDKRLKMTAYVKDGQQAHVGNKLATITGPLRSMSSSERVMLNFLQRLSGIATTTSRYVRAVKGPRPRSTTRARRARLAAAGEVRRALRRRLQPPPRTLRRHSGQGQPYGRARRRFPGTIAAKSSRRPGRSRGSSSWPSRSTTLTTSSTTFFRSPASTSCSSITWASGSSSTPSRSKQHVRQEQRTLLEASGNVTLNNVAAIAQCGVDRIAVGTITHSAAAVDIALDR